MKGLYTLKEKLKYLIRRANIKTYQSFKYIIQLASFKHPQAQQELVKIASKSQLSNFQQSAIIEALMILGTDEAVALLMQNYKSAFYRNIQAMRHLQYLNNDLAIFIITDYVSNFTPKQYMSTNGVLFQILITAGKIADARLVSPLIAIFEQYPNCLNATYPYTNPEHLGTIALLELQQFRTFKARLFVFQHKKHLRRYLSQQFRIESTNPWNVFVMSYFFREPIVINRILGSLERRGRPSRYTNLLDQCDRLLHHNNDTEYYDMIMNRIIQAIRERKHVVGVDLLLEVLAEYRHESLPSLALELIENERCTPYCVQILSRHEVRSEALAETLIDKLEQCEYQIPEHLRQSTVTSCLEYLTMMNTTSTDNVVLDYLQREERVTKYQDEYRFLKQIAKRNDRALEVLGACLSYGTRRSKESAIKTLGELGERALPTLISLLHTHQKLRKASIEALGNPQFELAIPHLANHILEHGNILEWSIRQTLETIDTESAYGVLNAWDSR